MTEKISWKKKIKKLQIIFFVLIMGLYIVYGYFSDVYDTYKDKKQVAENLMLKKIPELKKELSQIKDKQQVLKKINGNYKNFVLAYNSCYTSYIKKKYGLQTSKDFSSLRNCMDKEMFSRSSTKYDGFIKNLNDKEIEKLAMSFGVDKTHLEKFEVDQKKLLASLDQEIFDNKLEEKISVLSLGKPVLLDKKLNLYRSSFTFTLELNFKQFMTLLGKLQNKMYVRNYNYYTISNISSFDIVRPDEIQKINIQGNFYFTK